MTAAVAGAAGSDLTALFVSVVPSFAGMGEAVKGGGAEAAAGFTSGFAQDFHPFKAAEGGMQEGVNFFAQTGGAAAGAFTDAFGAIMKGDMPNLMGAFDIVEGGVTSLVDNSVGKIPFIGGAFSSVFEQMTGTLDAFKGPAGEFLNLLIDMGTGWQDWERQMAATTFDLGEIKELKDIVRDLGTEGLDNLDAAAESIGILNNRLSDLNPEQLKETTKAVASMSELFGDVKVDTDALTGVMNAFDIEADDTAETVNKLGNMAVVAGVPINELLGSMETGGASLRAFGYDLDQMGTLLGNLNKEGVQVPKFLAGAQQAASKFIKAGLTPEEGWEAMVTAVKEHLSNNDPQAAEELIRTYFPKSAPAILEAFKKDLIDLPSSTNALEGIDRPLEDANDATQTLADALGELKVKLDAALQPLSEGMADALTEAGGAVSDWITTHQGDIVGAVSNAMDLILHVTFDSMKIMSDIIIAVAPAFNPIIDAAVFMGKAIVGSIEAIASIARHLPGVGDEFAKIDDATGRMYYQLDQIQGIDVSKYAGEFGEKIDDLANKIPGVSEKLHGFMDPLEASANFSDAMKQNITDMATGESSIKDMFEGTEGGGFKLIGTPEEIAESKRRLYELGVAVTTGPDGIVTKVVTGNKKIQEDFKKWYQEVTDKPLDIKVQLQTTNEQSISEIMDNAGIPSEFQGPGGVEIPTGMAPVQLPGVGSGQGLELMFPGLGVAPGGGGGLGGYGALGQSLGLPTSGGAEAWRPQVRQALMEVGAKYGITNLQAWEDDMVKQIDTESGGQINAINLTDSNAQAGHPSQGLMQFIPSTYEAHNITGRPFPDPVGQIYAAIDYVTKRYGMDPQGGPNFIGEGHGYQTGGSVEHEDLVHDKELTWKQLLASDLDKPDRNQVWKDHTDWMYANGFWERSEESGISLPPFNWIAKLFQQGGHAELPQFNAMQQPIPGEWQPGTDSVHGVLEVGEYVVRRDAAAKNKGALDAMNFGGMQFQTGGTVPYSEEHGVGVNTDIRQGAPGFPPWVARLEAAFGAKASTYPGHQDGFGIDWGFGQSVASKQALAEYLAGLGMMPQIIWQNPETGQKIGVADGEMVGPGTSQPGYYAANWAGHNDHVHTRFPPSYYSSAGGQGQPAPGAPGSSGSPVSPLAGSPGTLGLTGNYEADKAAARLSDMDANIADKQKRVSDLEAKIATLQADAATKQSELDALLALPAGEQKLKAADIAKARDAVASSNEKVADANDQLADATGDVTKAQRDRALEGEKPPKEEKGAEGGTSTDAAALGKGLIKGMFQELGFPDVFGKPFTEWGIWKLAMGGAGYGMGLLQNMGSGQGTGTGTGGTAAPGGGGGDFLSSLLGPGLDQLFQPPTTEHGGTAGALPGPEGVPAAMAPGEAPANVPVGAQAGPQGNTWTINNNGVTDPNAFRGNVNEAIVNDTRTTQTVGGQGPPQE